MGCFPAEERYLCRCRPRPLTCSIERTSDVQWGISMTPKPTALVVEDDEIQRSIVTILLEECEMKVIACANAEAAAAALDEAGSDLTMIYADVHLSGNMNGIELVRLAKRRFPAVHVVLASGDTSAMLPDDAAFMLKPWRPLELFRQAERSRQQ